MAIISRLSVLLGLDAGEFNSNLGKAQEGLKGFNASALITEAAIAGLGAAFFEFSKSAIEFADQMAQVAKTNDVAVHTVLALNEAFMLNGGSSESAGKAMSAFSKTVEQAYQGNDKLRKLFNDIGVSDKMLAEMDTPKILEQVLKGLQNTEPALKRNGEAMQFFARAVRGIDIKGVAKDYEEFKNKFTGSDEAFLKVKVGVDALSQSWTDLKTVFITDFGPAIEKALHAMAELVFIISDGIDATKALLSGSLKDFNKVYEERDKWEVKYKEHLKEEADLAKKVTSAQNPGGNLPLSEQQQKSTEELQKQVLAWQEQIRDIGLVRSEAQKLAAQEQEGGKYAKASTDEKIKALQVAMALDKTRQDQYVKDQSKIIDLDIARLQLEERIAGNGTLDTKYKLEQFDAQAKLNAELQKGLITQEQYTELLHKNFDLIDQQKQTLAAQQTFSAGWNKAYNDFIEQSKNAAALGKEAFDSLMSNMNSALDNFVKTGKLHFKDLVASIIEGLIKIQLQAQLSGLFNMLGNSLGFGSSSSSGFSGGITNLAQFMPKADGGPISAGSPYLVGENGPELMIPGQSGAIIPNNSLSSSMGNQAQIVYNGPYIANMSAIDTQSSVQFLAKNKTAVWAANQSAQQSLPATR